MSEILAEMERTREAARLGVPIICILSRDVTAGTGDYYHHRLLSSGNRIVIRDQERLMKDMKEKMEMDREKDKIERSHETDRLGRSRSAEGNRRRAPNL